MKKRLSGNRLCVFVSISFMPILGMLYPSAASAANGDEIAPITRSDDLVDLDVADLDITELVKVRVSPFEVSSRLDRGYLASNSISASRFDTPIRELPFAIQAFTQSFIHDQKPVIIYDVARYSPGVTYRSNDFNEGNANLAIRGFAVSNTPGNVQILRDGLPGPSIFDFTNISRVEVVKGPASFLYGQVAPGGIVNIITKTPQPEFAGAASVRYGSYDENRFEADVTGPALENLFFRCAASYDHDMEYWDLYDAHSWNISPSLLWQPSNHLSITLKYEAFRKDEDAQVMQKPGYSTQAGIVPTPSDPNLSGVDVPGLPDNWNSMSSGDFRNSESNNPSLWVDLQAGKNWDMRFGYSHLEYEVDALFSGNFGMSNNSTFLQGRRLRRQLYANQDDSFQTDAVGKYNFDEMSLRFLLGAQYVKRYFDSWAGQAPNDPSLGSDPIASPLPPWDLQDPSTWNRHVDIPLSSLTESSFNRSNEYSDQSLYGGVTMGLFEDRLLLLAGWRWTDTKAQFTNNLTGFTEPAITSDEVTPQYGVLYKLLPDISLYASYAESFVGGSQILLNPDGTRSPAQPTSGQGIEAGIKAELMNGRLSTTLTWYDIKNKNIVNDLATTDSSGNINIFNVQSGEQRSNGIELDATASLTENWQLYLSYSYMDARITEFSGHDAEILAQDWTTLDAAGQQNYKNVLRFHDAPLQMSAPHLADLWTRYDFKLAGLSGFYVGGGINFVYDQTLLPDTPEEYHQTYTLVNAMAGYTWEVKGHRFNLDLTGKNLTDEYYRPSQSTRSRPREVLLTLTARF
jgi:iron complex outermembrane receptor protein